jgi:hypothetical protein
MSSGAAPNSNSGGIIGGLPEGPADGVAGAGFPTMGRPEFGNGEVPHRTETATHRTASLTALSYGSHFRSVHE